MGLAQEAATRELAGLTRGLKAKLDGKASVEQLTTASGRIAELEKEVADRARQLTELDALVKSMPADASRQLNELGEAIQAQTKASEALQLGLQAAQTGLSARVLALEGSVTEMGVAQ